MEKRAEEYVKLYKDLLKKERVYQRKLIVDGIRRKYSSLWLKRKSARNKAIATFPFATEKCSTQKDLFLVAPPKDSFSSQKNALKEDT